MAVSGSVALNACSVHPKVKVYAVVVDIRPHASPKRNPDEVVVEARTMAGLHGAKSVLATSLDCRVGDTVQAWAQGLSLTLDDNACERFGPPAQRSIPL